ncbi:MAG: hypothetical protein PSW75_03960, partial [bacterium]|nr:hypothetical protein [bacterium]
WALARLWRGRANGRWRSDLAWMAAAAVVPLAAALWWVWQADQIKALNPVADFLGSAHMRDFNLGNDALRFSPEIWAMKWRIIRDELTWLPLLSLSFAGLLLAGWSRVRAVLFCGLIFVSALWLFPVLYAYHDYYYVASAVALLLAAGLALVALAENARWRWLGLTLAALIVAGQMHWYGRHYYPMQQGVTAGGSLLTEVLKEFTEPRDVLVIVGEDWNSMTAYYAQRRVLMLRGDVEADAGRIDRALANLREESVGALLVTGKAWPEAAVLIGRLAARGLSDRPVLQGQGTWLFFPKKREARVVGAMRNGAIAGVTWAPGAEPAAEPLAGRWHELADLPGYQQALFASMHPLPVRFFCTFEPARQVIAHVSSFGAHPLTRLVFHLGRGAHILRQVVWFNPDAYNVTSAPGPTDGVELRLSLLGGGIEPRELASRLIDPLANLSDRGPVPVEFRFELAEEGDVELLFGPGPMDRDTRDWIWLRGPVVFD